MISELYLTGGCLMEELLIHNAKIIGLGEQGTIENGYMRIADGKIAAINSGFPAEEAPEQVIDAQGMTVMPSLTDCHTHLMEFATSELYQIRGRGQRMGGVANLLTALLSGITHLGEHHLGHPFLRQEIAEYLEIAGPLPLDVKMAFGSCFLGTESLSLVSSTRPGTSLVKEQLNLEDYRTMARYSLFPGENIFLNATVANLPLAAVPRAGEITYSPEELREIIGVFHEEGKKIGAHIEGDQAALAFVEAGGDVIHHGHNLSAETIEILAKKNIPVIITPHGGTSAVPTSPPEVYEFYRRGVKIALATDSYLPVHPGATWYNLPQGYLVGPREILTVVRPVFSYFLQQGVGTEDLLRLITVNGREILLEQADAGVLQEGNPADLILVTELPGIETTDTDCIKCVIKAGEILVDRR